MKTRIRYIKPSITDFEFSYATSAEANCLGNKYYDFINKFEDQFKQHLGFQYSIAKSICTGAFHMGMALLGLWPDNKVKIANNNLIFTAFSAKVKMSLS
jgi:perosamine synthetase